MYREQLEKLGINTRGIHSKGKALCPKCSDSRKNKHEKCLLVDVTNGIYKCYNCDWKGTVSNEKALTKTYTPPVPRLNTISPGVIEYFRERGISLDTLIRYKITESQEFMPDKASGKFVEKKVVCFNYYWDEELKNIKFRSKEKEFKMSPGAELIMYGMDVATDNSDEECAVVEGEIDALSFYEAGVRVAVSVPNGATLTNANLEYIDNSYEFFENKRKIVIAVDNDDPGRRLKEELIRRFGAHRCWIVTFPETLKDANGVLVKYGPEELKKMYDNAAPVPLEGVETVGDVWEDMNMIFKYGYPEGKKIGQPFDNNVSFMEGHITIITGIPGTGKTAAAFFCMMRLANRHGWKAAVFSPEQSPTTMVYSQLCEIYTGKPYHVWSQNYMGKIMSEDERVEAMTFVNDNFFVLKGDEIGMSLDDILSKIEELVYQRGIRQFILDPWNWIELHMDNGKSETSNINDALSKIVIFCRKHRVHGFVVAHPTKVPKDKTTGDYVVPDLYMISGSAHFYNKAYIGISLYRKQLDDTVEWYIQKIKYKWLGKPGVIETKFDVFSNLYAGLEDGFQSEMNYNKNKVFESYQSEAPF